MIKAMKIYLVCIKTALSRAVSYRTSFIFGTIITLLSNILFPLVTVLIYHSGASFPDWTIWEVLLLQSIYTMSLGISSLIFNGVVWETMNHIREGSFEIILLRPMSPLFYMIANNFDPECIGLILGGGIMTGVSIATTGTVPALSDWMQFAVLFLSGVAVMGGLYLIMAAISFKWVGNSRIPEIFDSVKTFGKYPLDIFPKQVKILTSLMIPVAMIGFYPCTALLGEADIYGFLLCIPCVLFLLFGIWLYNKMIKLYEGVGG